MKQAILTVSLAALLAQTGPAAAQGHQNAPPTSAAEIAGVPAGAVITTAFAEALQWDYAPALICHTTGHGCLAPARP
jgi:hypothetical protein